MTEQLPGCHQVAYGKRLWILFWSYIKITSIVVGGGYAIITAANEIFVRRKRWISEDEMVDIIAVVQTVPGLLACNSAVCVGLRIAGFGGALAALAGSIIPPITIIILVASVLTGRDLSNPYVQGAFTGVVACIVAMVLTTLVKMGKKVLSGVFEWSVAILCFAAMAVCDLNPGWIVLAAIPVGILYVWSKSRRMSR